MKIELENVLPEQIEQRSFEIIEKELGGATIPPLHKPVVKRVIHTTADFDYLENLKFSDGAVNKAIEALKNGASIVTDTNMAKAGINKTSLLRLGGEVFCFMGDEDVARQAKENRTTRATVCMEKAANSHKPLIFAIGNAPTALVRLYELYQEGIVKPLAVIGVPVGFVNVVQSKELILSTDMNYIVAQGRKGGSNVAAAICNALIYMAAGER